MVTMARANTTPLTHDAYCPACGYNVRGLEACRCPECGGTFDPAEISLSQIPWTHRHRIERRQVGRVRAFFRTVRFVTVHARQMAIGGAEELSRAEARRFRLVCEVLLAVPICAALLGAGLLPATGTWLASIVPSPSRLDGWGGQLMAIGGTVSACWPCVLVLGLALSHWLAVYPARLAAFLKYPAAQRENLITAAHYLVGALLGGGVIGVVAGVIVASLAMGTALFGVGAPSGGVLIAGMAETAVFVAALFWLIAGIRYFRQAAMITGTSMRGVAGIGLLLAALWLGVWCVLMPVCVGVMVLICQAW